MPSREPNTKSSNQIGLKYERTREPNAKSSKQIGARIKPSWKQIAKSLIRDGWFSSSRKFEPPPPLLGLGENAYFAKSLGRDGGFRIWLFRALQSGLHPPVSRLLTRLDTRSADLGLRCTKSWGWGSEAAKARIGTGLRPTCRRPVSACLTGLQDTAFKISSSVGGRA